jgi:hypothetical protein
VVPSRLGNKARASVFSAVLRLAQQSVAHSIVRAWARQSVLVLDSVPVR